MQLFNLPKSPGVDFVCWGGEYVGGWLLWLLQHIVDTRGVEDIVQAEAYVVG